MTGQAAGSADGADQVTRGGGGIDGRPASVGRMFLDRVAATPHGEAYRRPVGDGWESMTWAQAGERVTADRRRAGRRWASSPSSGSRIVSSTRVEWALADFAHPVRRGRDHDGLPDHQPGGRGLHPGRLRRPRGLRRGRRPDRQAARPTATTLPDLTHGRRPSTVRPDGDWVIGLDELRRAGPRAAGRGRPTAVTGPRRRDPARAPGHPDLHLGTTGRPKGVRLAHDCWVYEGVAVDDVRAADRRTTCSTSGCRCRTRSARCCWPPRWPSASSAAVDGRVDKIVDNLAVVSPTFMAAAPRIFEKVRGRVVTHGRGRGRPRG